MTQDLYTLFALSAFMCVYISLLLIYAANHICYITELTGCSYLVLQSRNIFAYLVLGVFLVLQAKYDVFDKPGYARILLSIYANKSRRSVSCGVFHTRPAHVHGIAPISC